MTIQPGTRVEVLNGRGELSERVAVTGVVQGRDFPVVHVARVDDYRDALAKGRAPEGTPWPAEDVHPLAAPA
ncbi:MAG: hypothetical protein FWD74_12615 [Actinomycetia bacterium]|nr:hypothetical protein [Actinomycetes bacterium]